MKIKINKDRLQNEINKVSKVLNNKSINEVFELLKIEVLENRIMITASDGVQSIQTSTENTEGIEIISEGKFLINGKIFQNVIKKQKKEIILEIKENSLIVNSKNSKVKINLIELNSYPVLNFELPEESKMFSMDKQEFEDAINKVSISCAENDKRMLLNGINISSDKNSIIFIATDSYRLSVKEVSTELINGEFNITLFNKNIKNLITSDMNGKIKFIINDDKIMVKNDYTISQIRLIDGIFPFTKERIPKIEKIKITVPKKELNEIIDMATVASLEEKTITLNLEKGKLILISKDVGTGQAVVEFEEKFEGVEDIRISLNSTYIKQSLSNFNKFVDIFLEESLKPIIIKSGEEEKLIHIILPQRIN